LRNLQVIFSQQLCDHAPQRYKAIGYSHSFTLRNIAVTDIGIVTWFPNFHFLDICLEINTGFNSCQG